MENSPRPAYANGKICYVEIPALDINQSSGFYQKVFGWAIREDHGGNVAFDDSVGQVSGMWVLGMDIGTKPGPLISIMVFNMSETLKLIVENKGRIVQLPDKNAREQIARFADPAGNIFSLYQHNV